MSFITTNPSYIVSNVILSKRQPFTVNDIDLELKRNGENLREEIIQQVLNKLNENGIITKMGYSYILTSNIKG